MLILDVDEAEAAKLLASLDPISALAGTDKSALAALVGRIKPQTEGMRELMTSMLGNRDAENGAPVLQAGIAPRVSPGELWSLGEHRLYCGDAREVDAYEAVLGGGMADMLFTDPPYGVGVASRIGMVSKSSREARKLGGQGMLNDDLAMPELQELLRVSLGLACDHLAPGSAVYVAGPSDPPPGYVFATVLFELGVWRQTIIWAKDRLVIGRSDYQRRHEVLYFGETDETESARESELIFYGATAGGERVWRGGRKQDSVWEIPAPHASPDHPSMKPVNLVARAIRNSSEAGALVLDPFAGSGTTAIAAELEGRRAALIELDPRYCDAIVARWEHISGVDAIMLEAPGAR